MIEIYLDLFVVGVIDEYDITNYQKVLNNYIIVSIYVSNIYDFSKIFVYVS
jgi:hypothetical protein